MKRMLFLCATALLLIACSNPKEANKKNFTKAVQEYLDTQDAVCVKIPRVSINIEDEKQSSQFFYIDDSNKYDKPEYNQAEVLVKLGLLNKEKVKRNVLNWLGNKSSETELLKYSVTQKGEEFLIASQNILSGTSTKFCSGQLKVADIVNFTEPGDSMGIKISEVKFKVKLEKLADWVNDKELQEVYSINLADIETVQGGIYLKLTNEGWKPYDGR